MWFILLAATFVAAALVHAAVTRSSINQRIEFVLVYLLAGYHGKVSPLAEIITGDGPPVGRSKAGSLVFCFPVDYGRWTRFSSSLFRGLAAQASKHDAKKVEIWITGEVSERARSELEKLGVEVHVKAGSVLPMVD